MNKKIPESQDISHFVAKASFRNHDQNAARGRLRMAKAYRHQPQELSGEDFRNISTSIQWCYDNEQWKMVIDFTIYLSGFFEQQSFWQEGVYFINSALEAADYLNATDIRPQLFFDLGLLYDRQGQLTQAEHHYQNSAETSRQLNQTRVLADAQHRLGWIAHSRRDFPQAKALYEEAKSLREALDNPDPIAISRSWHQLGMLAQDMGDYDLAQTHYETALDLRREKNEPYLIATSLHQLGALAVARKEWQPAQNYFKETLSIRQNLKDRGGEANALDQLGFIAQQQQQWQTARTHYIDSIKIKGDLGDKAGLIRGQLHMGEVCLAQKNWDEAKAWFQDCLTTSQALENVYFEGQAHLHLGSVYFLMSDYETAVLHYEQGLELLDRLDGMRREQARVLYQLGLIAHNQGHLNTAQQRYLASLEIQEQEGLDLEAAMTHLQLGMIYQAYDVYDAAQHQYQASYLTFKKEGVVKYEAQAVYRLGNIAELEGRPDQACIYYRQTKALCQQHNLELMKGLAEALSRVEKNCIGD